MVECSFMNEVVVGSSPVAVTQTFSQTEFVIGKSNFAHIMHFH